MDAKLPDGIALSYYTAFNLKTQGCQFAIRFRFWSLFLALMFVTLADKSLFVDVV